MGVETLLDEIGKILNLSESNYKLVEQCRTTRLTRPARNIHPSKLLEQGQRRNMQDWSSRGSDMQVTQDLTSDTKADISMIPPRWCGTRNHGDRYPSQ